MKRLDVRPRIDKLQRDYIHHPLPLLRGRLIRASSINRVLGTRSGMMWMVNGSTKVSSM